MCVSEDYLQLYNMHISVKGLAADKAGLKEGDQIVSVNRQDVTSLKHEDLVGMIKKVSEIQSHWADISIYYDCQAGAEGSVTLGVIRSVQQERSGKSRVLWTNQWTMCASAVRWHFLCGRQSFNGLFGWDVGSAPHYINVWTLKVDQVNCRFWSHPDSNNNLHRL